MNPGWTVRIAPDVRSAISILPPARKRLLREVLRHLAHKPEEGKRLERELRGYLSYRARTLRIIYRLEGRNVLIEAIGDRSEIYEKFTPRRVPASGTGTDGVGR